MAAECQRVCTSAATISGDFEAAQMAEEIDTVIENMDELASYMDQNELLPHETASDMLKMYKYLSSQLDGIDKGRRQARKLRGK
jgi:flagellin-specific chaperone FliS